MEDFRDVSELRFYSELAPWWPVISPPSDYRSEATFIGTLFRNARRPVRDILELGSGGGSNASYLKQHYTMTLVDISPEMLEVSRRLNPECAHGQGDMRTVRIARKFDAVFVHDAIDYMTTEDDLRAAMRTAFEHLEPGGIAVFVPDETREKFEETSEHDGNDGPDGWSVRYTAWSWDPDPTDDQVVTEYVFMLRPPGGPVRVIHETHHSGLFTEATWLRLLAEVGFQPEAITEVTHEDRPRRTMFLGHKP